MDSYYKKAEVANGYHWEGFVDKLGNSHRVLRKDDLVSIKEVTLPESLYKKFAVLAPTEDSFIDFALKYGLLGTSDYAYNKGDYFGDYQLILESFSGWVNHLLNIRCVIELWDAIKPPRKNINNVFKMITIVNGEYYFTNIKMASSKIMSIRRKIEIEPEVKKYLKSNIDIATYYMASLIRGSLFRLHRSIWYNPLSKRIEWYQTSCELYQIIYQQLANDICNSQSKVLLCDYCQEPIVDAKRSDRLYHKGSCQKRAYRARMREQQAQNAEQAIIMESYKKRLAKAESIKLMSAQVAALGISSLLNSKK